MIKIASSANPKAAFLDAANLFCDLLAREDEIDWPEIVFRGQNLKLCEFAQLLENSKAILPLDDYLHFNAEIKRLGWPILALDYGAAARNMSREARHVLIKRWERAGFLKRTR